MDATETQPPTVERVEERKLTTAEQQPLNRPPIAERKTRARADERSSDERTAILSEQVALLVKDGHTVEYESAFDAVLVRTRRFRGEQRVVVAVDESGGLTINDQ